MSVDVQADAVRRYEDAVARRDQIRRAWEADGCELLAEGSMGQMVEHPLVKMLREHDALVDKLARPLKGAHRGPRAAAVVQRSIGKSPETKLRVAK